MIKSDFCTAANEIFGTLNINIYGFCPFDAVTEKLLCCRASERLKNQNPCTVIMTAFPYRHKEGISNLAGFARVPDYHAVVGSVLGQAALAFSNRFKANYFEVFVDNSPIPEVFAAAVAGLGKIGKNGLLIHPSYGSWIVLGSIVTDMPCPVVAFEPKGCTGCDECTRICPGNCIDNGSRKMCASSLTQKKGELTEDEISIIRKSGLVWGCDLCQEACPMNQDAVIQPHPCFGEEREYMPILTKDVLRGGITGRAYEWRGIETLQRNIKILNKE